MPLAFTLLYITASVHVGWLTFDTRHECMIAQHFYANHRFHILGAFCVPTYDARMHK